MSELPPELSDADHAWSALFDLINLSPACETMEAVAYLEAGAKRCPIPRTTSLLRALAHAVQVALPERDPAWGDTDLDGDL